MDEQIQYNLDLITESVLQAVPAETIYLFGSYAYGTPNGKSDLDIYVVVPDNIESLPELQGCIRELLWGRKTKELDLIIGRSSVFNHRKKGPTLERVIAQKGTILYGT
jgi:predicted nucleotidyltransferase